MHRANGMQTTLTVVAASDAARHRRRVTGAAVPVGLALAGLGSAAAGLFLRRRGA